VEMAQSSGEFFGVFGKIVEKKIG
jgi:hypothetical protein